VICLRLGLGPGAGDLMRVAFAVILVGVVVTRKGRGSRRHWGSADHFLLQLVSDRGGQGTAIGAGRDAGGALSEVGCDVVSSLASRTKS
jgi:hypothetical protein